MYGGVQQLGYFKRDDALFVCLCYLTRCSIGLYFTAAFVHLQMWSKLISNLQGWANGTPRNFGRTEIQKVRGPKANILRISGLKISDPEIYFCWRVANVLQGRLNCAEIASPSSTPPGPRFSGILAENVRRRAQKHDVVKKLAGGGPPPKKEY